MAKGTSYLGGHTITGSSIGYSKSGKKKSAKFGKGLLGHAIEDYKENNELGGMKRIPKSEIGKMPKTSTIVKLLKKQKNKKDANRT